MVVRKKPGYCVELGFIISKIEKLLEKKILIDIHFQVFLIVF